MKKICRYTITILLITVFGFLLPGFSKGDETMPLIGQWAFTYAPETIILQVFDDGKAVYREREYIWESTDDFLILTDAAGNTTSLRYLIKEDQKIIYPQTAYHRGKDVDGQKGLIGIWEGVNDSSSFVFTPAGYFLEDNSFSGNYMMNETEGTFLLHYGDAFADTICYYSIDSGDILTVEYPWPITEAQ